MTTSYTFIGSYKFSWFVLNELLDSKFKLKQIISRKNLDADNSTYEFEKNCRKDKRITNCEIISVNSQEELKSLKLLPTDYIFTAGYSFKLPNNIISKSNKGSINIHPSLLPRWKGPDPIRNMILNNDDLTGVSAHEMNNEFDSGKLIFQTAIANDRLTCFSEYQKILGRIGGQICSHIMNLNKSISDLLPLNTKYLESYAPKKSLKDFSNDVDNKYQLNLIKRAFS